MKDSLPDSDSRILSADEFARQTQAISVRDQVKNRRSTAPGRQALLEALMKRSAIPRRFNEKSFENYDIGDIPGRKRALQVCKRYADNFDDVMKAGVCLVLTGRPGAGKTHLAIAALKQVVQSGRSGLFVTVSEMLRKIRSTYAPGSSMAEQDAIDHFIDVDLLVLDEVGVSIGDKEKRAALIFDVLNTRYNQLKPTIILGNLTPVDMERYLGARVWDRLMDSDAPIVSFDWDSYRRSTGC